MQLLSVKTCDWFIITMMSITFHDSEDFGVRDSSIIIVILKGRDLKFPAGNVGLRLDELVDTEEQSVQTANLDASPCPSINHELLFEVPSKNLPLFLSKNKRIELRALSFDLANPDDTSSQKVIGWIVLDISDGVKISFKQWNRNFPPKGSCLWRPLSGTNISPGEPVPSLEIGLFLYEASYQANLASEVNPASMKVSKAPLELHLDAKLNW